MGYSNMWKKKGDCILLIWMLGLADSAFIASDVKAHYLSQPPEATKKVCMSKDCIVAGSQILSTMDKSVNPCDNFYNFACGQFAKNGSPNNEEDNIFAKLDKNVDFQIRDTLEERSIPDEIEPVRLMKRYYNLCMDERKLESDGAEPLLKVLKEIGGWPVLGDDWDADGSWSWLDTIYKFRKLGISVNYLIKLDIERVNTSSSIYTVAIYSAELGLSRDSLVKGFKSSRVKKYYNFMVDVAVLLHGNRTRARQELLHSLNFEMELAQLPNNREQNKMTFGRLNKEYPSIPLKTYVSNILNEYVSDGDHVTISTSKYLTGLEKIVQKTPKRVISNYLVWRAIQDAIKFLPKKFRELNREYSEAGLKPRWAECVELLKENTCLGVYYMYVQRYEDNATKWELLDLVDRMKKEIYAGIKDLEWMDDDTKDSATKKVEAVLPFIGYNEDLFNVNKFIEYHKELKIKAESSLYNAYLSVNYFLKEKWSRHFRSTFQREAWDEIGCSLVANAFHIFHRNVFHIFPPMLQGYGMTKSIFTYMNYATIGYLIGHEIFHGLDYYGLGIDKEGQSVDWWEDSTLCSYVDKTQCFVEQYNNFSVKQINKTVDGKKTIDENIADNAGANYAYRAYLSWAAEHGEEPKLPGFENYTLPQIFWISFANFFCSYSSKLDMAYSVTEDSHSPLEFRLIGPVSNLPDFSKDFDCPVGSNMNPKKKCFLW